MWLVRFESVPLHALTDPHKFSVKVKLWNGMKLMGDGKGYSILVAGATAPYGAVQLPTDEAVEAD